MSITTYTGLCAHLADRLERADLTTQITDAFIPQVEARVNRWMRDRNMQGQSTATIEERYTLLPTDFGEAITLRVSGGDSADWSRLDPAEHDFLAHYTDQTGRPRFYSLLGIQLEVFPIPDQAYTAELTYFSRVPALSATVASNWLLASALDVYVEGAMEQGYEFLKDYAAADRCRDKFQTAMGELTMANRPRSTLLRTERGLGNERRRSSFNINTGT